MSQALSPSKKAKRRKCALRPKVVAVVPSAGSGRRLGLKIKKPFVLLGGHPLITYAIRALDNSEAIDGIIIAAERPCIKRFKDLIKRFGFKKIIGVVAGGRTRFQSVKNCLKRVASSFDIVLIHDGARPFLEKCLIEDSIRLAARYGACIVAVPESDTLKLIDRDLFEKKTLNRERVYRAQTPQAFRRDLIIKAYGMRGKDKVTDDASLVEILGNRVKVLKGSYRNIKITTREDLRFAEVLL